MNTNQNNRNYHYSPQGSNYRHDDGDTNSVYTNNPHNLQQRSQRTFNIDDMPIPTTKARNFEELLESNLREMGMDAAPLN